MNRKPLALFGHFSPAALLTALAGGRRSAPAIADNKKVEHTPRGVMQKHIEAPTRLAIKDVAHNRGRRVSAAAQKRISAKRRNILRFKAQQKRGTR
ncbi:MAG: hypothetical protein ACREVL_14275 [Solimonas sp.]